MSVPVRVCLVSASGQNVFFAEILEAFGDSLREQGLTVEESTDCFPPPADDLVYLFIPHEYHPLVDELAHPSAVQLGRSVALCTEQPGTHWFDLACGVAEQAAAVVDINALGVRELRRRGIAAEYAPLGYVASWDHWRRRDGDRSIDLAFLGGETERRTTALARCARVLDGRHAAIHLTETVRPHTAASPYFLSRERKWKLMADSKAILNIHRDELPYLEWHRTIGAILNGCVVLSEHSIGTDPLVPGEHFVSARYDDLPWVLEGLLSDPERLDSIRKAAYDTVREQMPASDTVAGLLSAIERASDGGVPASVPTLQVPPMPVALPAPPPDWEAHVGHLGPDMHSIRMGLKHLVVQMRNVERRLSEMESDDRPSEDVVERLGPPCDRPRISVLLTVYDYGEHVGEALRSVALAETREVEVIAVDDASSDGSVEAIRQASEQLPWLPITLVRRSRNHGLPAARNLALEHARAGLVFILDADNAVFPHGLGALADALDGNPGAAFAYGVLERFDAAGPFGLMNWQDWDPLRLRQGNYIDAMAMIRRSELQAVGGYPTDPALLGWEDFAVWIAIADAGKRGVRVADFVARYRDSSHSMISLTSIDISAAWAALLRKHPSLCLPEDPPGPTLGDVPATAVSGLPAAGAPGGETGP